jgi:hypothetical protein
VIWQAYGRRELLGISMDSTVRNELYEFWKLRPLRRYYEQHPRTRRFHTSITFLSCGAPNIPMARKGGSCFDLKMDKYQFQSVLSKIFYILRFSQTTARVINKASPWQSISDYEASSSRWRWSSSSCCLVSYCSATTTALLDTLPILILL